MNITKLMGVNWDNAVSLNNYSSNKSEESIKIEEQIRAHIKNIPIDTFERDPSATPVKLTAIEVPPEGRERFKFIAGINERSIEERKNIMNLIEQSVKNPSAWSGDYSKMFRAQTGMQLQVIAEKLIPKKYQEQMGRAIKEYQEEGYKRGFIIHEALQAEYKKILTETGRSSSIIKSDFQEKEHAIRGFYRELDFSNPSNFIQSFEKVLENYKDSQKSDKDYDKVIRGYQEDLRTKWNEFASILEEMQSFKLPTTKNSLYNILI
ncbi:hypothetical protein I6G82_10115 [Lysinibacillus macroides]|uniref:Uncharacterized protein n=1 Tax=Lysinibacillus macroides TaxID=33935 RepID=A0A0M9DIA4_9BACI|nr:hypothetical protein [Lysinibacillus macroides]KOY80752.1 hypothetical protein ADM90_16350 [Lysinibacillus macroides]QPR69892.1 hypothetical protein I6G82_10115 [Lysinibacillus macroides]